MSDKQLVENSINVLNEIEHPNQFEIKISGIDPKWKTVYKNNSNISEGFKTWREVAIFLSGFRKALMILI